MEIAVVLLVCGVFTAIALVMKEPLAGVALCALFGWFMGSISK